MADEVYVRGDSHAKGRSRHPDRLSAELARRQHGVVALRQLLGRGIRRDAIKWRLRSGHLSPVHRGVYAIAGTTLSRQGRWMAATLTHPRAVLSYRSAAALWQLRNSWHEAIEVTVPNSQRPSLHIHRDALVPDEVTAEDGIPVTTPARTLLDLAAVLDAFSLERALHEAGFRRLTSPTSAAALLARHELIQVDCLWRDARLIVELDARASHETSRAFEADRSLQVLGFRVLRVTDRALRNEPDLVERQLRALIG